MEAARGGGKGLPRGMEVRGLPHGAVRRAAHERCWGSTACGGWEPTPLKRLEWEKGRKNKKWEKGLSGRRAENKSGRRA